jgi:RNA polymerase sigma-70 factor (ECF subfamily)
MDTWAGDAPSADGALCSAIKQHWNLVEAICRRHLAGMRGSDIDDAVQETFVQLLIADRSRIDELPAWLIVVATRVCARIHRKRYLQPEACEVPDERAGDAPDPADVAVEQMSFGELLAVLSPPEREVVVLRYGLQLSYDDIAARIGISAVNARQIALRARRRLQDALTLIDPPPNGHP